MSDRTAHKEGPAALELVVLLFNRPGSASQALQALKKGDGPDGSAILDSAVLIRDQAGETFLFETGHVDSRHGVLLGTVLGAFLGVMGKLSQGDKDSAPAAQEAAFAVWTELDLAEETLARLQAGLRPGGSALVLLAEQGWVGQGLKDLAEFGGEVLQQRAALSTAANLGICWEGET